MAKEFHLMAEETEQGFEIKATNAGFSHFELIGILEQQKARVLADLESGVSEIKDGE